MLGVKLLCVGKMKEPYYTAAFEEYRKRIGPYCRFDCQELPEQRLPSSPSQAEIAAALHREGDALMARIQPQSTVISLCVEGRAMSSEAFARLLQQCGVSGQSRLCFVIGGSFGLDERVKALSGHRISMSEMTFPHHLARIMLMEQLYRAFSIIEGSRYHK